MSSFYRNFANHFTSKGNVNSIFMVSTDKLKNRMEEEADVNGLKKQHLSIGPVDSLKGFATLTVQQRGDQLGEDLRPVAVLRLNEFLQFCHVCLRMVRGAAPSARRADSPGYFQPEETGVQFSSRDFFWPKISPPEAAPTGTMSLRCGAGLSLSGGGPVRREA